MKEDLIYKILVLAKGRLTKGRFTIAEIKIDGHTPVEIMDYIRHMDEEKYIILFNELWVDDRTNILGITRKGERFIVNYEKALSNKIL